MAAHAATDIGIYCVRDSRSAFESAQLKRALALNAQHASGNAAGLKSSDLNLAAPATKANAAEDLL
ncbi:hypothetical protein LBMAG47_27400 [Planctomycetia bacterium]|nr:hypothetical protein LBMAG47_27400 [Planctomycetia bacterium]